MGEVAENDYLQPEGGYRFSQDSVLLARFAPRRLAGRAADLGAGCGVVGLEALAQGRLGGLGVLYLIEAGEDFRESLAENARRRGGAGGPEIRPLMADWRFLGPGDLGGPLDYCLANPPFHPAGSSGRPRPGRHEGRHETRGDLGEFLGAAGRLLKPGGGLAMCWPRARLADLTARAAERGFAAVRIELPPRAGSGLVLVELAGPGAWPGGRGIKWKRADIE
ncbi:MAG: hypothetical protein LBF58_08610 [Deltaproteobacteria bacterium]|nr:hypothetical protein [Deltaproteobacteria bacterium]